jgi:hypothetical protein
MPTATAKAAPTQKVTTKTITTAVSEPVEEAVKPPAAPLPEASEDFWKYIQSLTPDDWKTHTVGLYRYPLGQTKPQKLGRYVKTYKAECPLVSEDQIFEEFGGSQYDALLRGPHPEHGRQTLLAKHSWEMDGPAKNPWQTSATGGNHATPPPSDTAAILETLLKHLQNLQTAKNPAQDPAVKESIALIQQLTSAMPKQQGITELVAGLADLKKLTGDGGGGSNSLIETIKVLKDLGIIGAERKSLATELKEIMEIAGMVGGGGATTGGGRRDWVTSLIDNAPTILEKVTPIADKFADAARNNARVAEIRAGRIPAEPVPSTRPAPALAAPATATPAAAAPAAEAPASRIVAAPETEPATGTTAKIAIQAPSLDWVKARAVQLFATGKDGDAVAEWLDSIDEQLGNFLGSMDADKFSQFVKDDPILSQIATAPRFPEFVEQFVDYFATDSTPAPEK